MSVKKTLRVLYRLFVIFLVIIIIIQPDIERPLFYFLHENALWVIIALVGMGMFFMLFRNEKMIYFNLLSAAVLTFFLKDISSSNLVYTSNNNGQKSFRIYQISAEEFEGMSSDFLKLIYNSNADILSVGEVSPELKKSLKTKLEKEYPYIAEMNRIDFNSRIVFSKFELIDKDTIYLKRQPQLCLVFKINEKNVQVIFPYILPYNVDAQFPGSESQIEKLTEEVNVLKSEPLIVIGEFNQVYWTKEMREFIYRTRLNNARRFVYALADRNPYNHVFYTGHINCIAFEDLYDNKSNRIGVMGSFEMTTERNKLVLNTKP